MGYDGGIIIVKKKVVEKVKHLLVAYSFSELYENYLYMWEYPEEYGLPEDEKSIGIDVLDENVFDEYFRRKPLENGESRIIPKSIYDDFLKWIEDKIKSTTLYDITIGKIDDYTVHAYINVYKFLKDLTIDWNKEYVVFRNDW
jgi:hypothetical protein|nr:MAG TPA: hypothetical protein [Caudoviricetes sp.]